MSNVIEFPTQAEPITEEMIVDFLEEHQIEDADDLDAFSQFIHLLMMEPNIPLQVIN